MIKSTARQMLPGALIAAAAASCSGQSVTPAALATYDSTPLLAADTVRALDKSILVVHQASTGHYWFGSDTAGIFRYDGRRLIHYTMRGGLTANRVREIVEDTAKRILFATLAGVVMWDGQAFSTPPIVEAATGKDWALTSTDRWLRHPRSGVYRWDSRQLQHLQFPKAPGEDAYFRRSGSRPWSPYEVWSIYADRHGAVWFGTSHLGVCRWNGVQHRWLYEQHLMEVSDGGWFGVRSIIEDAGGTFWFCNTRHRYTVVPGSDADNPLLSYQKHLGIPGHDGDSTRYFMSAVEDDAGHLWMATYNHGILRYDGKTVQRYWAMKDDGPATVFSIYKDRRGTLWLGTHNGGAYRWDGHAFEKF